ncbi:Hypothetical predicted protein [Marmota monax]|uniref:Uncharacterized protein n=1 Tax=Marmota monax TaxID=9995 RepID=A0A5E4C3R6_MARMO|nr:hypothetical protein GHT09_015273 [Marmota monax]VTJ76547.1 Hypothetical predicted protein [Marmota monax]
MVHLGLDLDSESEVVIDLGDDHPGREGRKNKKEPKEPLPKQDGSHWNAPGPWVGRSHGAPSTIQPGKLRWPYVPRLRTEQDQGLGVGPLTLACSVPTMIDWEPRQGST